MDKKRNNKLLIPIFIFIAVFIVGLIGLLQPQKVVKYDYLFYNVDYSSHTGFNNYGFDVSFCIENKTSEQHENVPVKIVYMVSHALNEIEHEKELTIDLNSDKTEIQFAHNESNFGVYTLDEIESVTITVNGKSYNVQNKASTSSGALRQKVPFAICAIIGFMSCISLFISWISSNKTHTHSLSSVLPEKKSEKSEKSVCQYCKCSFNADKYDKCPNCGASIKSKG